MEYSTLEPRQGISETGIIYEVGSLYARFEQIDDPRKARGKRYTNSRVSTNSTQAKQLIQRKPPGRLRLRLALCNTIC